MKLFAVLRCGADAAAGIEKRNVAPPSIHESKGRRDHGRRRNRAPGVVLKSIGFIIPNAQCGRLAPITIAQVARGWLSHPELSGRHGIREHGPGQRAFGANIIHEDWVAVVADRPSAVRQDRIECDGPPTGPRLAMSFAHGCECPADLGDICRLCGLRNLATAYLICQVYIGLFCIYVSAGHDLLSLPNAEACAGGY